ncbi:MAG: hydrolase [Kocuria rhizophila]|nr:MAG: hydrolase [Kocuria rhizophila]
MFGLFHNAKIHSMNPAAGWTPQNAWHASDTPHPDAILTSHDRIVAVGDYQELKDLAPLGTEHTDMENRSVLPGLGDAHIHSAIYARSLFEPDMRNCRSLEEALDVLKPYVAKAREDESITWILGGQWNVNIWDKPVVPDRKALDSVSPDIPVALGSMDWHTLWLNSKALEELGLDRDVPNPNGGTYVRDEHGELTGILREAAAIPVRDGLMQSDVSGHIDDMLPHGQRELLKRGITSIHDIDGADCLYAYQKIRERGELDIRIHKVLRQEQILDFISRGIRTGSGDEWISIGPLKLFTDGAVGDQAVTDVLDSFEANRTIAQVFGLRQRVEHAQYIKRDDILRFQRLGVTASMQPLHCPEEIPMNDFVEGRDMVAYGWNSLRAAGTPMAFGSDGPVVDPNPFFGIHAAVCRSEPEKPANRWQPEESIGLPEALCYYTHAVARASYEENLKGCLAPGMLADFIAVDRDVFAEDAQAVKDTVVEATVVGAQIRYQRER